MDWKLQKIQHAMIASSTSLWRLVRFGTVGFVSNSALFVVYLLLVESGLDGKLGVGLLYVLSLSITFAFYKRWTFSHRGRLSQTVTRYVTLYAGLYITNVFLLWVCVDVFSLHHVLVQASVVILFIPIVFFIQRHWIFPEEGAAPMSHQKTIEG